MTSRRDLLLAGSSALAGVGTHAAVRAAEDSSASPAPGGPARAGIPITEFGADPDRPDNADAIQKAVAAALRDGRDVFIPVGDFRFSQLDLRGNDGTDPRRLVLSGPGTLRSERRGVAITASRGPFYDLVIDGPAFESSPGKGTTMLDGDRLRRLVIAPGTQFRNIDWVIRAKDYLQSVRMIGAIIRGGAGAVVSAPMAFDCLFTHNIIEFATDGFVIDGDNDPALNRCSIDGNLIEGIGGRAIVLGTCLATTVSDNYLESNTGGDIRLDAGTAPHKGLRVQGNGIQLSTAALAAGRFGIIWGRSTALPVRAGGNFCNGNLHDTAGTSALIDMNGDVAAGQLYRGYDPRGIRNAPVGRATFSDGLAQHITWFERAITIDPHQSEIAFAGRYGAKGDAPVLTFGPASPQEAPDAFDRKQWARGSVVFNVAPQPGKPASWVCTRAGTPGTWNAVLCQG
ncbi:hypothetical protein [Sphingomonas sp. SORGH_AS_0879]|uniref:hypothetical protein n=1 Tax=Sphingomonas sp. SORGH_AS_0879 TaxID=3041790 RepID=UPI00277D5A9E|nr:hypothetical protein [Sphingomonas sp. SORGH_AS_0879]MDQ1228593.1 hypothetical protein [Sphingomonas sp. SORGH_AS_0879]